MVHVHASMLVYMNEFMYSCLGHEYSCLGTHSHMYSCLCTQGYCCIKVQDMSTQIVMLGYTFTHIFTLVYMSVQKLTSGILLYHLPPHSLRQGISLNLELSSWLEQLISRTQGFSCPCLPSVVDRDTRLHTWFLHECWDYSASSVPAEQSLKPYYLYF